VHRQDVLMSRVWGQSRRFGDVCDMSALTSNNCRDDAVPRTAERCQTRTSAPLHSITSSAMLSSLSGTVKPSILAVEELMTNSNLLDCTTGRSAGLAALRSRAA
jgi:hypothetical protein